MRIYDYDTIVINGACAKLKSISINISDYESDNTMLDDGSEQWVENIASRLKL